MFCDKCGGSLAEDSLFCSHCGAKIQASSATKIPDFNKNEIPKKKTGQSEPILEQKQPIRSRIISIITPIISLILISGGLSFYYYHEKGINKEVLQLKTSAEETALNGDYKKAKEYLQLALEQRPDYTALTIDLEAIEKAYELNEKLVTISNHIKITEFDTATKELANVKDQLSEIESPLFEPFQIHIEEKEVSIKIGTIKKELNSLTTIDQLGGKLSILASLPEEEASAVKQEILNKIVQISTDDAEEKLANKQYNDAFSTIDQGLQFVLNNEKLLALKDRVENDQSAFEHAEQQRIEKAMEAAAQEDLQNRTAAAEVVDFSVEVDEYGDLYLYGTVKNTATTNIYSVTIYFSIYDENGAYLDNGNTSLYPYYLQPGETGNFEDTYYGVYQNVTVDIDNITWYLD